MQTFLPYKDFTKSAKALDNKRLNKQILEGYQILRVLGNPDPKAAWRNHPAVKMWRGHEYALHTYIFEMVAEADLRGIKTINNVNNLNALYTEQHKQWGMGYPSWYNDDLIMRKVTTTHRANLYRKDSFYYNDFGPDFASKSNEPCCERCNYYWPTHKAA